MFNYDDVVRVVANAEQMYRPGAIAWVVAVFHQKPEGASFDGFPDGVVYSIEFEDGEAIDIPECMLEPGRVVLGQQDLGGDGVS